MFWLNVQNVWYELCAFDELKLGKKLEKKITTWLKYQHLYDVKYTCSVMWFLLRKCCASQISEWIVLNQNILY